VTKPIVCGTCVDPASVRADWTTTSGFSPGWRVRKTLMMRGSGSGHVGADDGLVGGVADRLLLRGGLALDQGDQLADEDRVVAGVVDPAPPEDAVVALADERLLRAGERRATVGQRHLVDDRCRPGLVRHDEDLDPDLARGVVEPIPAELAQVGGAALGRAPALPRQPSAQQLELARRHGRRVDLSHERPPLGAGT